MSNTPDPATSTKALNIWQLNTNKSNEAQTAFAHDPSVLAGSLIAIQEPYLDHLSSSRPPAGWRPVYPTPHFREGAPRSRSFIAVNPALSTNDWEQIACPSSDITSIRVITTAGPVLIINVYNPCDSNRSLPHVESLARAAPPGDHIVLLGDFNRHHPTWDESRNSHLFTSTNLELAQPLLDLVGEFGLQMALPQDIPTLQSTSSKNYTRPDNVFVSSPLYNTLIRCDTAPDSRPPCTDHIPVCTEIDASPSLVNPSARPNFAKADWDLYRARLAELLEDLPKMRKIRTQVEIDSRVERLREAIQAAVLDAVPTLRLNVRSKRWWTADLKAHRKAVRALAARSYRARWLGLDPVHAEFKAQRNLYTQAIRDAKRRHWEDFLEQLDDESMWTAASYLKGEHTDGGRARVPNLRFRSADGQEGAASNNEQKSRILLEAFFPPPPPSPAESRPSDHPRPVMDLDDIHTWDIAHAIRSMKPNKAPGPDGLPACVYIQGISLLVEHLLPIFRASFHLGIYPREWKHSKTAVLRKAGKPDYGMAKAYRPIALLNVVSKILSTVIANRLNTLAMDHNWIPAHHFGGQPGRTTSDALHLLTKTVKDAWARGQVASALFLDVKGAFPHAHPARLAENMRKIGVPKAYVLWMLAKLDGRTTCLAFDDYLSDALPVSNGIDQGCPLSVIFYLLYNSPLIRIPTPGQPEMCIGYVDDVTYVSWGRNFEETHRSLIDMLDREGGALEWSRTHNSTFELDKTACIDFSRNKAAARPSLVIGPQTVTPVKSHTLLGVILDQELRWQEQCNKALAKGMKWSTQLTRLAKMSYGATATVARRLYTSIAVPRFTYAADVWFTPVTTNATPEGRSTGSVGFAKRLTKIQSTAARAILGALRSSPVDSLDAHASLLPIHLLMNEACQRAAIRLASAPPEHPLSKAVLRCAKGRKAHIPPLQRILQFLGHDPTSFEKWKLARPHVTPHPALVFPSKQIAVMNARTDQAHLQLYTDGAASSRGVGCSAILLNHRRFQTASGARLGDSGSFSVLDAEVAGILVAAHLILDSPVVDDATIFTDSQSAISCIRGRRNGATEALLKATRRALTKARQKAGGTEVRLQWCPGHQGVPGNELADAEAKAAAGGRTYPTSLTPRFLTTYRSPVNPVTLKKLVKDRNRTQATLHWENSTAGIKYQRRYPHLDAASFMTHTASLPRSRATLLYRLITGHVQLRQHLHRLRATDSPMCEHCQTVPETVAHYLLRCPRYSSERYLYLESLGLDFLVLDFLFSSSEALLPVFDFVRATGRFSDFIR